jgi:hypothetical protein
VYWARPGPGAYVLQFIAAAQKAIGIGFALIARCKAFRATACAQWLTCNGLRETTTPFDAAPIDRNPNVSRITELRRSIAKNDYNASGSTTP